MSILLILSYSFLNVFIIKMLIKNNLRFNDYFFLNFIKFLHRSSFFKFYINTQIDFLRQPYTNTKTR